MKKPFVLNPSLAEIEHRLFGVTDALIQKVREGSVSRRIAEAVRGSPEWAASQEAVSGGEEDAPACPPPPMPSHLADVIRRRVAARDAGAGKKAAPGRIVQVRRIVTPREGQLDWVIQAPLHVLLDAPAEAPGVWHGWLMAAEADYATWWDFVVQEDDGACEPEAAMVQAWNPVRLYEPMIDSVVGELTPARLQAVRALAGEYATGDAPEAQPAWPGRVAARQTLGDLPVVTGSPIRADDDPRVRYQQLYFHAADALREPARLALAESVRAPSRAAGLVARLFEAARVIGQELVPVPRVATAMSAPDETMHDLLWPDRARLRLVLVDGAAGEVEVTAFPGRTVVCRILRGGVMVDKVTAGEGKPVRLAWENGEDVALSLTSDDGDELSLPLTA